MRALLPLAMLLQLVALQEAVSLVRQGRYQEADQKLQGQQEPSGLKQQIAFHRLKAAVASGLHRYGEAAEQMTQALRLAPGDNNIRAATAIAFIQGGANGDASQVLAAAPQNAFVLTLEAIADFASGDFQGSEQFLLRAIAQDKGFEPAYQVLERTSLQSNTAPAPRTLSVVCSRDRVVCDALQLKTDHATGKNERLARSIAGLEAAPRDNPIAQCGLGQGYQWTGRWQEAEQALERCVQTEPTPRNHYRLAMVYRHLGKAESAQRELAAREALLGGTNDDLFAGREALRTLQPEEKK